MDVCLTETAPALQSPPEQGLRAINEARWIGLAFAGAVGVGILWRVVRYFCQFPIWGDEAMLLMSILDRDYLDLMQPLRYAQVAPLFFLWLERTALLFFGAGEWSMHLFPTIAGMVALLVFSRTCRLHMPAVAAGLAVGVLAVSYYPIRHACEVKPYAFDLCFAVLYVSLALGYLRARASLSPTADRWLIGLAVLAPLAVLSSYPSVFVGGSVSLVLLPTMRDAPWKQRCYYVIFNVVLLSAFLVHVWVIGGRNADSPEVAESLEFLRNYWKDAFPPDTWHRWPLWLLQTFTGNMLAYPLGAKNGGSSLTFLLVVIGTVALWRQGQRHLLALCWFPFALNCVAACFKKYPFGDSARITLHLAPFICVLMAVGLAQTLEWIRNARLRQRTHVVVYLALIGCGLFGVIRDLCHPYKTEHDRLARQLVRELATLSHGEAVHLAHMSDREVLVELAWYLRTEDLDLHWQPESVDANAGSYWFVQFSHKPIETSPTIAGWRITSSETRMIPPENAERVTVHARITHLLRE